MFLEKQDAYPTGAPGSYSQFFNVVRVALQFFFFLLWIIMYFIYYVFVVCVCFSCLTSVTGIRYFISAIILVLFITCTQPDNETFLEACKLDVACSSSKWKQGFIQWRIQGVQGIGTPLFYLNIFTFMRESNKKG